MDESRNSKSIGRMHKVQSVLEMDAVYFVTRTQTNQEMKTNVTSLVKVTKRASSLRASLHLPGTERSVVKFEAEYCVNDL